MMAPRRHFCSKCGTHIYAESPARSVHPVLKIETLDDPFSFFANQSQFLNDRQTYDMVPKDVPSYQIRKPPHSGGVKVDDLPSA